MKVAIIGSGVSGLVCAHLLHRDHDITVFEADARVGGHANTVTATHNGRDTPVDTGFIVYNERNYPNLTRLFRRIEVPTQPAPMSFSVRCDASNMEYGGSSIRALYAQRRNLIRPRFHRMLADILRFNRRAPGDLANGAIPAQATLGEYLERERYGALFVEKYLLPMGSAIWSAPLASMRDFPLRFFVRFFDNHGMLQVRDRPQWRTVVGGSREYVARLTRPFRSQIETSTPVLRVRRYNEFIEAILPGGERRRFDEVVFATHSDQALRILDRDATRAERDILGAIPYQANETVLHSDAGLLPRRRRAWSSWNYHLSQNDPGRVAVSYNMSILQSLEGERPLSVTLNRTDAIDPRLVHERLNYSHPQFTEAGLEAQRRHAEVSGRNRTHYCGAYWGNGFHEDGVVSALRVGARFGVAL
ncbi:MAG: NAD(P)/FAD-dependent oxidoreductase [Phycisphaerales bacterium]